MKTSLHTSKDQLTHYVQLLRRYTPLLFLLFLVSIYGFLCWRILSLSGTQPDPAAVSAELKTVGVPKVDEEVVRKMEQLKDNSVSVQTLFDEARSNPFKE
ncbi:MAG TPA: hypothetical protein VK978_05065 [Candidatus Saccharimonadales bacterium]|nr:hypothetical protein [Candidatus Saccharimonadales bacterium]